MNEYKVSFIFSKDSKDRFKRLIVVELDGERIIEQQPYPGSNQPYIYGNDSGPLTALEEIDRKKKARDYEESSIRRWRGLPSFIGPWDDCRAHIEATLGEYAK